MSYLKLQTKHTLYLLCHLIYFSLKMCFKFRQTAEVFKILFLYFRCKIWTALFYFPWIGYSRLSCEAPRATSRGRLTVPGKNIMTKYQNWKDKRKRLQKKQVRTTDLYLAIYSCRYLWYKHTKVKQTLQKQIQRY